MEKQRWEESERRRKEVWRHQRRGREEEKRQVRKKVGKSRFTLLFQWFVAPEGRKVGSLKRRVRSDVVRWEMKNCTPLWCEAHVQVKMYKQLQLPSTFRSWAVEKVHAVVVRSTFPSQNVESATCTDHFWGLRCGFAWQAQGIVNLAQSEQNVRVCSSFSYNHQYATLHYATIDYTTLHYTTLNYTTLQPRLQPQLQLRYFTLHYTRLHYMNYPTLHYTWPITPPLQYTCKCTTLIAVHHNYNSTTLQLQLQLHYTTLHPEVVGEVTTATIATTPKNTAPTSFQSISGFALPSVSHNNQPLL